MSLGRVLLRGKPQRHAVTYVVGSTPAAYKAIRAHLNNSPHAVILPHAMLAHPGAALKLPDYIYDEFTNLYSEDYLGALYTFGGAGRPYVNWVYPFSTAYKDAILRETTGILHGSQVKILPYVSSEFDELENLAYSL